MSEAGGISRMGTVAGSGEDAPQLGIGMLGYAFMCNAHTNAFLSIPHMMYPPVAIPRLVGLAGRSEANLQATATRYGYQNTYTRWQDMLENDAMLTSLTMAAPTTCTLHPPSPRPRPANTSSAKSRWHARLKRPKAMLDAAVKAGVKHMVAYNYRFVPAIIQARRLIQSGALGRIFHFRAVYLQDWIVDPEFPMTWRFSKEAAGSGALGDLASHILDIGRFLVGEPTRVMGMKQTFIDERPDGMGGRAKVDVDDAVTALLEFESGALGTIEATRFALGHRNGNMWEVNGENGSIRFNLERLNELDVYWGDGRRETLGFTNVLISEDYHPYWENWWPPGT